MPVRLHEKESGILCADDSQVCARGWQDYMMETCCYQDEAGVAEILEDLSDKLRELLGLEASRKQAA